MAPVIVATGGSVTGPSSCCNPRCGGIACSDPARWQPRSAADVQQTKAAHHFRATAASTSGQRRSFRQTLKVMAAAGNSAAAESGKTKVLFVCLGNICRSPSAEAVFKAVVEREGLADRFFIDSCGTGGGNADWYRTEDPRRGWSYHEGDAADSRMRQVAARRDMQLTSRSRPLTPQDLTSFDYVIGMDASNLAAIHVAADHWASQHEVPTNYRNKVKKMTSYLRADKFKRYDEVPDPYFAAPGQQQGFDLVLDLLEDACEGLLEETLSAKV